jgi:chromosome segregation ATPase
MTKLEELEKDFNQMNLDLKAIQHDMKSLEVRILVAEKDVLTINKQLDKISANTTWILRLIISGLLTGVLGVVAKTCYRKKGCWSIKTDLAKRREYLT